VHGMTESTLRVEWHPLGELGPLAAQWRELAERAIEPNVFYEPAFALAAAPALGADAGAGLVWSRAGRLVGLFPARVERRYGVAPPILIGWTHPYAPLGAPLVDGAMCKAVVEAWLDHIVQDPQLPKLVLLPYFPVDGPLAAAFDSVVESRTGMSALFGRHARALLAPRIAREDYLARAIEGKKRKELRRQRKRLGELGGLTFMDARTPAAVAIALDEFFAIEARGWKGRAGTAARCDGGIAEFMQGAVTALAAEGKAQVLRLCMDARPIAAIIVLRSGSSAWCWKIAYDEVHARFSPGVQLLLETTDTLLRDGGVTRADSCATPDHPMIDHVWRERLVLADRLISPGPGRRLGFGLTCGLEGLRRRVIGAAKAVKELVRRR
jgi:CelD/BcsL family acetyltransferase involved in cellulose biosynthesis